MRWPIINMLARQLGTMFPGYFPGVKHDHYRDFGYPEALNFSLLYGMYQRNGLARAAIDQMAAKTWQDVPCILEAERDGSQGTRQGETALELEIRQRADDLRLWQVLVEADRRSMVGEYAGLILRFADGLAFSDPVGRVPGGLGGLVEVIPAWQAQLEVSSWDADERSDTYGHPLMFQFNEAAVGAKYAVRSMTVHPDRVIVWSRNGTIYNDSLLGPGFNDLLTLEKVSGAGGEGFWKNAKGAPVLEVDKDADIRAMADAMGVPPAEVADRMNAQVEDWQRGFDKMLMVQGIAAKALPVTLPSPEHFHAIALQQFAASVPIPLKILVGSQTGERASTEDAAAWAQTNHARRQMMVIPNIMALVNRLERVGILPERDWFIDWSDLTEATMAEKVDRAVKMADVNAKTAPKGEWVFTPDEIREVVGKEPIGGAASDEPPSDDEADAAMNIAR